MKPDISIVISLYNRKELIKETLESIHPDKHPGVQLEAIVVDDGSTDNGDFMVEREYPWVSLIRQKNSGAPIARNKGLSSAQGKYILFVDSDDLIEADFFREKFQLLEQNLHIGSIYGPWAHFNLNEKGEKKIIPRHSIYPIEPYPDYHNHLTRLLGGWYIAPHAILWRKDLLLGMGGFNPSLPINQDVDLLFRFLNKKYLIIGISSPRALRRDHDEDNRTGNISNNIFKLKAICELRKKFIQDLTTSGLLSEERKKTLANYCFNHWVSYRKTYPGVAEDFYQTAINLNPKIQVNGGIIYQLLGKVLGPRNAVIFKSFVKCNKSNN